MSQVESTRTGRRDSEAPPRVARWTWIVVLVVGIVLFELVRRTLVATQNPNFLPSLILLGAAVVPAAFLTFVASRRLPTDLGSGPIVVAALLGGVIGTVVAGTLEYDAMQRLGGLPMLAVALIEEAAKLIIPAAMLAVARFRHGPANGLVLGVASGAGFAALETMGYALTVLVQTRGNIAAVDGELLLRGLLSPAAHMAWTGLTAAALWRWTRLGHGLWWFLGTYVVAVVLHTVWDSVGGLIVYVVLAIVAFTLLILTTHRLGRAPTGSEAR
ncbi:PrsW family intramembrane metalloprotease [Actinomycetospora termitidis]|uniref:PrsW family intramembrane metalloprotease n=1 Tax=Actinomycetospora termitidis TaxID=3053470 RepID=A0ABT7MCC4_9PSEU|nr:PrsW family intramembrane metalloprotease [Actinomycetospora sp. Odt1-22]MDL5158325.1 PrsW family intramembrane metalloprotease [Actinomycetospora sp. Odt1-22]